MTGVVGRFDRQLHRRSDGFEPAQRIETYGLAHAPFISRAETGKRGVKIGKLCRKPLSRRRRSHAFRRKRAANAIDDPAAAVPGAAALRDPIEDQDRRWRADRHRIATHDGALEGLERSDLTHADVTVT